MTLAQQQMQDAIEYLLVRIQTDTKLKDSLYDTPAYGRLVCGYDASMAGAAGIEALGPQPEELSPCDVLWQISKAVGEADKQPVATNGQEEAA